MATTSTDAASSSSSLSLSPLPQAPSSIPGSSSLYLFTNSPCSVATPTTLFTILPITFASPSLPGPIILSLPAPTLEPYPIPTSPFVFSSSITTSDTSTMSESSTTTAVDWESTTIATSSISQVTKPYTTTVAFTTTMPITVVAIVGSAVGGVGGLVILTFLALFCLRKRRKVDFDGNFDPAHVNKGGGGGTLPKIDLGEDGLMGNIGVEFYEDDGMGGRLGPGPGCGRIKTPYPFQLAPVSGATVGGKQHQNQPQTRMQQMLNIGIAADGVGAALAARYPKEKRAKGQQYVQHTPNLPIFSGYLYPSSPYPNLGGSGSGGIYYQPIGRRPSPGPYVMKLLSPSTTGGRNAKEMEKMGGVISNPKNDGHGQLSAFQQAYLQTSSGPHHQQQCLSSSYTRRGTSRRSRCLLKGEEAEGKEEVLNSEIPPTYDS